MTRTTTSSPTADLLADATRMGAVTLRVADLDAMTAYYRDAVRLGVLASAPGSVTLGRGGTAIVVLEHAPDLRHASARQAGLFHTAVLFETEADLAAVVYEVARRHPGSFTGSADHLVSEAFYFSDPEGNGIELYWDRPRDAWSWDGKNVVMDSLALPPQKYLQDHLTQGAVEGQRGTEAGVGHVHLQVGDVQSAHDFYVGTLGFEKTAGWHGQALFVSAGGYHHHMAMNVWNSRGAGPRRDTLGLGEVLIEVPAGDDVGALADRLKVAGVAAHHTGAELRFEDPWRNRFRVAVR
jgi:catechol 2,3-dioxygenase